MGVVKLVLVVLVAGVVGALLLADGAGRAPLPRPAAATPAAAIPAPAPESVITRDTNARLTVSDPRTLKPLKPQVTLPDNVSQGVLSPGGRTAAFPHNEQLGTKIRLFDVARNRVSAPIDVGGSGPVEHLTWLSDTRLAVFSGIDTEGTELVEIERGRVVERSHFAAEPIATARRRDGMVALLAPPGRIGRAKLLIVGPRGQQQEWPLRFHAGFQRARPDGVAAHVENVQPGLAVDPATDVVYVVDAEEDRLHTIDLRNETGTDVALGPIARAAKQVASRVRYAAWLGGGRLAVSGHRDLGYGRIVPHGLRIVDVAAPQRPQVLVARRQSFLAAGEGRVLAWDVDGGGIAIHDRNGKLERHVLKGVRVVHAEVVGPYAYVGTQDADGRPERVRVLDLRSGRVVQTRRGAGALHMTASTATATRAPVLGVRYPGGPRGQIATFDPVTLQRVGRRAVVHGYLWDADRSPSGSGVALGVSSRGRIAIYGTEPVAYSRTIETGRREGVMALRWPVADRMVALTDRHTLELSLGHVIARAPIGGRPLAWEHTADGLAVLVGPEDGDTWLLVLRPRRKPQRIELPGIRSRMRARPDVRESDPPDLTPGLAVDGGFAYVADPEAARIVRVDLATGAVTSHPLGATAAKGGAGRMRGLQALGGGRLLLTAQDVAHNGRVERQSTQVVGPGWRARTLAGDAFGVGSAQGILLPDYERRHVDVLDPSGRRLARHRPRFGLSNALVHGRYGYVINGARKGRNHRTHVIDLRTGRKIGSVPSTTLPRLLP